MAGGGGPLDIFNAFGNAASGLGDLVGGAVSGSGGQGVTPSGSVLPQTATGDILTNPTVTSQIAQQAGGGDQQAVTDEQQFRQAQQAAQPTFVPPPQQAPAQVTQGQTPEQLGWTRQQTTAPWPQRPAVDPTYGGIIGPPSSPNIYLPTNAFGQPVRGIETSAGGQPIIMNEGAPAGGDQTATGDQGQAGGQPGGQQRGQQKTPLQRAGNVLKGLAAQNARASGVRGAGAGIDTGTTGAAPTPAPSNVALPGGFANPLEALASLFGGGTLGQGLQGIANQIGAAPQGSGGGAGVPPTPAAGPTAQGPAPQPPTAPIGYDPTTGQPISGAPGAVPGAAPGSAAAQTGNIQQALAGRGISPAQQANLRGQVAFPGAAPGETAPTPPAGVYGVAQIPNEAMVQRTQLAGTDTRPTAGFSRTMREQRAPFRQEIERNPRLRAQLAAMATLEHASDPTGPIESVMNRTAAMRSAGRNVSLDSMVNSKFYGPFRTGQMQRLAARYEANPAAIPRQYNVAIDTVLSGSNILGGATDQGSGRDPNVAWRGGKVVRDRETYNDWGGGLGHEGNARWRRETQRQVQEEMRGGMQVAQAQPLTGPPPSPTLNRLRNPQQYRENPLPPLSPLDPAYWSQQPSSGSAYAGIRG